MPDSENLIPLVTLVVSAVWGAAEVLSIPKSRKQLKIPHGDWLSVSLAVFPVLGVVATVVWQYFFSAAEFHPALVTASLLLCLAGIVLRTWSKMALGRLYTFAIDLVEGHRVLTEGPYRFVRHPLYLGTFLAIAAFPMLTESWATVGFLTLPTAVVYGLRLFKEEAYLMRHLGADYQTYVRRTARLIPFLW